MSYIVQLPPCGATVATQSVAATSASTAGGTTFQAQTFIVRLTANVSAAYAIGDGAQSAATTSPYLPAHVVEYVRVRPGQSIAVIRAATSGLDTATNGTVWVSELTA